MVVVTADAAGDGDGNTVADKSCCCHWMVALLEASVDPSLYITERQQAGKEF